MLKDCGEFSAARSVSGSHAGDRRAPADSRPEGIRLLLQPGAAAPGDRKTDTSTKGVAAWRGEGWGSNGVSGIERAAPRLPLGGRLGWCWPGQKSRRMKGVASTASNNPTNHGRLQRDHHNRVAVGRDAVESAHAANAGAKTHSKIVNVPRASLPAAHTQFTQNRPRSRRTVKIHSKLGDLSATKANYDEAPAPCTRPRPAPLPGCPRTSL